MVFRELLHPSSDLVLEKYSCRVGIDDVLSLTEPVRPLPFRELSRGGRSSERGRVSASGRTWVSDATAFP